MAVASGQGGKIVKDIRRQWLEFIVPLGFAEKR